MMKGILNRFYLIAIFLLIFGGLVVFKLFKIQIKEADKYKEFAKQRKRSVVKQEIPASRGNVITDDGFLVSVTLTSYDVSMDLTVPKKKLFEDNYKALADSISKMVSTPKSIIAQKLKNSRNKKSRYLPLLKNISHLELQRVKEFPIIDKGRFKGGLILESKTKRRKPLKDMASRTIGFDDHRGKAGIEGQYSKYLKGKSGSRLMQKIAGGRWKPMQDENEIEPIDGKDITTTINVHLQDVLHNSLYRSLKKFEADHGCAIVMEVETGKIKAISNLKIGKNNEYYEERNYAVYEAIEPGSTFKLMSLLALLEDGKVSEKTTVNLGRGTQQFYGYTVRDSHRPEKAISTLKDIFKESSNVGFAKLIHKHYKSNPNEFLKHLKNWGLSEKLGIDIPGEGKPKILNPKDKKWSKLSLPWMAYGYGVHLTPIQILSFYNAIANEGKMVKPQFIQSIADKKIKTEVLNPSIASKKNIQIAKNYLHEVVKNGTGKNVYSDNVSIAGKTGTAQMYYWKSSEELRYLSSFVGFFPVEKPKYSCFVMVSEPNKKIGYYGGTVAAPVFKDVALAMHSVSMVENKRLAKDEAIQSPKIKSKNTLPEKLKKVPNLKGLSLMAAIPVLENSGIEVNFNGSGMIESQSVEVGKPIFKGMKINLTAN